MNIHSTTDRGDKGFTLVEILIAIVLVGILAAVAVVGISNLVNKGSSASCNATKDAANAATAVYFASNNNTYPINFYELAKPGTTTGAAFIIPSGVTPNPPVAPSVGPPAVAATMALSSGTSWTLTMHPGVNGGAPTFDGCPV